MPPYADLAAVKARAGALSRAWTDTSRPSESDILGFLEDTAAEINALLQGRGLTAPAVGSDAAVALRGVNADAALVLALEATYPEGSGPASALEAIQAARDRVTAMTLLLRDGKHPAVLLLESASDAPSASSFWQNEPTYGETTPQGDDLHVATYPAFHRGQPF